MRRQQHYPWLARSQIADLYAIPGSERLLQADFVAAVKALPETETLGPRFFDDLLRADGPGQIGANLSEVKAEWVKGWEVLREFPEEIRQSIKNTTAIHNALQQPAYDAAYFTSLLKSKEDPQNFIDNFVNKLGENGKFIDGATESEYASYLTRKAKEGKPPRDRSDWKEAKEYWLNDSPLARGNAFNETARIEGWYPFDEVTLANGKRVDSYRLPEGGNPGEIISRKATDLDDIQLSTFDAYLSEMKIKYAPGTPINAPKYGNLLKGKVLEGDLILELPDTNLRLINIQEYIDLAKNKGIKLRFKPE